MEIKLIKLKLKSGVLTEFQSDTIFGMFCWRLKEISGDEMLSNFLRQYRENKPVFSISDGFISDGKGNIFFPKPVFPHIYNTEEKTKLEKIEKFLNNKEKKKIGYIGISEFNSSINGEKFALQDREIPEYKSTLRTSVEIDREKLSAKKSRLFSYSPKYLDDEQFINIFIKVLDNTLYDKFNCDKILLETFMLGYGKKKSAGYGEIEIIGDIEKFDKFNEPSDSNGFIILGNYIPSKEDKIEDMYYDFFVKYSKLGEEYAKLPNPFKRPIIFFKPGSVFKTKTKKEFYGRVTKPGEIHYKPEIIQNGIPFTLRINI